MAMNTWFRYPYLEEANDGTGGAAGGSGGAEPSGSEPAAPAAPQTPVDIAAGMFDAMQKGLSGESDDDIQQPGSVVEPADGRARDEAGRFVKQDPGGEPSRSGSQPASQPAKPAEASQLLGADGQPIDKTKPQAPKKADDFALTDDEKKGLRPQSQQRFQQLITHAKEREAEVERLSTENAALSQARDNIMTVLTEHKVEPDDFVQLVSFNRLVKDGDLDGALAMVEDYRGQLLRALGREAPGVDLLTEHPDLKARVDAQQLSREDALALVKARRLEQSVTHQNQQHQRAQQSEQQVQRQQNDALSAVNAWNAKMRADLDYDAKAAILLPELEGIIRDYPPNLWVPTLDRLYKGLRVTAPQQQEQQQRQPGPTPLRPSGAKGGAPAPSNYAEAIANGLGYQPR